MFDCNSLDSVYKLRFPPERPEDGAFPIPPKTGDESSFVGGGRGGSYINNIVNDDPTPNKGVCIDGPLAVKIMAVADNTFEYTDIIGVHNYVFVSSNITLDTGERLCYWTCKGVTLAQFMAKALQDTALEAQKPKYTQRTMS